MCLHVGAWLLLHAGGTVESHLWTPYLCGHPGGVDTLTRVSPFENGSNEMRMSSFWLCLMLDSNIKSEPYVEFMRSRAETLEFFIAMFTV